MISTTSMTFSTRLQLLLNLNLKKIGLIQSGEKLMMLTQGLAITVWVKPMMF